MLQINIPCFNLDRFFFYFTPRILAIKEITLII